MPRAAMLRRRAPDRPGLRMYVLYLVTGDVVELQHGVWSFGMGARVLKQKSCMAQGDFGRRSSILLAVRWRVPGWRGEHGKEGQGNEPVDYPGDPTTGVRACRWWQWQWQEEWQRQKADGPSATGGEQSQLGRGIHTVG